MNVRLLLGGVCLVAASSTLGGCRTSYAFRAPDLVPVTTTGSDHSTKPRLRFVVFGDSGQGNEGQRVVAKGMAAACAGHTCDFGVVVGDNIYPTGLSTADDPQLGRKFHDPYDELGIDLWLVPGNHDWYDDATLQPAIDHTVHASNSGGHWKMPFDYYGVPSLPPWLHIFGLDTSVLVDAGPSQDPARERALQENAARQLAAARQALCGEEGWRILVGHHFVYSSGSRHGGRSTKVATWVEPVITGCGIQLYLSGHDHHQELLRVETPRHLYYQVVQGAGSEHRGLRGTPPAGTTREFVRAELGFSIIEATPDHLRLAFYVCSGNEECAERHVLELRQP